LYTKEIAKICFFCRIHIDSSWSVSGALVHILMDLQGKEYWETSRKRHPFRTRLGNLFSPAYSQLRARELTILTMVEETCSSHFHQYQMPKKPPPCDCRWHGEHLNSTNLDTSASITHPFRPSAPLRSGSPGRTAQEAKKLTHNFVLRFLGVNQGKGNCT
jgi:hypothetical protein